MSKSARSARHRPLPFLIAFAALGAAFGALMLLRPPEDLGPVAAEVPPGPDEEVLDAFPSARPASLGATRDPLSVAEVGYGKTLADGALAADATDAAGEAGGELLSVELPLYDPAASGRVVVVTYYDYTANGVVSVTVDLTAGAVVGSSTASEVQPPPSPNETSLAAAILVDSPEAEPLVAEYLVTTGRELALEDLAVTGGSYLATDVTDADDACGTNRCIELQIQEPGGLYLTAVDFVVDLTARQVIVLDHDAPHGHGPGSDHGN